MRIERDAIVQVTDDGRFAARFRRRYIWLLLLRRSLVEARPSSQAQAAGAACLAGCTCPESMAATSGSRHGSTLPRR